MGEKNILHVYNRYKLVLEKGDGVYLYDTEGKKYLDFAAGIAVSAFGYNNKEYNDAVFLTIVSPTLGENSEYDTYQEKIADYIKTNNIEVPVLIDEGKKCFDIYGIERYPSTIFIDEYGNVKEKLGSKEESGKLSKDENISKLEQY